MIWEERAKMTANAADDIRVIEEKVFDVRLNGYSVASWESKHTKELGISFVVSIAGGRMIDRFIEVVEGLVHRKDHVQFHSSLFLQHVGIQKVLPDSSDYALIHIHGELTDVAIIHGHSCSFFGSYPFGIQHIIRTIAQETNTTEDAAESTLNLIVKGDIDPTQAKNESGIIEKMGQAWIAELKKLLTTSPTPEAVPSRVIISARSHEDFFVKSLKSAFPQSSPELLTIEKILPHVAYETHAEQLRITGLYIMAIHSLLK
jgi:cell division ATPase FtsA